jgi:hypothetical protein
MDGSLCASFFGGLVEKRIRLAVNSRLYELTMKTYNIHRDRYQYRGCCSCIPV